MSKITAEERAAIRAQKRDWTIRASNDQGEGEMHIHGKTWDEAFDVGSAYAKEHFPGGTWSIVAEGALEMYL